MDNLGFGLFLIGACAGSLATWVITSNPEDKWEKRVNRISLIVMIISISLLFSIPYM